MSIFTEIMVINMGGVPETQVYISMVGKKVCITRVNKYLYMCENNAIYTVCE